MAVSTVSQGGVGADVVVVAEMGADANLGLFFLALAGFVVGPAELGSESNFVLVKSASEAARPELESDPNSATASAVASAVNAAAALPCSPPD